MSKYKVDFDTRRAICAKITSLGHYVEDLAKYAYDHAPIGHGKTIEYIENKSYEALREIYKLLKEEHKDE